MDQQQMDAIRNIGLQRLGIVQSSLGATPANLGGTVQTPMYSNTGAGLLGGALAGAQLGSAIPGVGTAIGAVGGGLLGLLR
jgi:phage tail tape-measure protein